MRIGRPIKYPQVTKEILEESYIGQEHSLPQISRELNIPVNSLGHYLRYYGIKSRTAREAHIIAVKYGILKGGQLTLSTDELRNLYWEQNYTLHDIALKAGCSTDRVKRVMQKCGIPRRTISEASKLAFEIGRKGKGGRHQSKRDGYVSISNPEHPKADKQGYVLEHILVWEKANNKPLPKGWIVHHLNGIKSDNRPENLLGMPRKDHNSQLQLNALQKRIRDLETKWGY